MAPSWLGVGAVIDTRAIVSSDGFTMTRCSASPPVVPPRARSHRVATTGEPSVADRPDVVAGDPERTHRSATTGTPFCERTVVACPRSGGTRSGSAPRSTCPKLRGAIVSRNGSTPISRAGIVGGSEGHLDVDLGRRVATGCTR